MDNYISRWQVLSTLVGHINTVYLNQPDSQIEILSIQDINSIVQSF